MKEILAVVRMDKMNETKRALADAGVSSITARDVLGRGKGLVDLQVLRGAEKGYEEAIEQLSQGGRLVPKRALVMVVPDSLKDKVVKILIRVNQTGKSGDGVIFVSPCMDAVRIRTGEDGNSALDEA
ncbi:MAG: P-II family nitrogen regulator [Thermodesulfobacteriota bacterium]|nr:P-II family nitrogen regulator [Thermodesulfobacteriota bacterium]